MTAACDTPAWCTSQRAARRTSWWCTTSVYLRVPVWTTAARDNLPRGVRQRDATRTCPDDRVVRHLPHAGCVVSILEQVDGMRAGHGSSGTGTWCSDAVAVVRTGGDGPVVYVRVEITRGARVLTRVDMVGEHRDYASVYWLGVPYMA